jgi:hypothetical protein
MIWFRLLLACCLGLNASQADPACSSIVRKTSPHHIQRLGSFCLRHLGDTRSQGMLRLASHELDRISLPRTATAVEAGLTRRTMRRLAG